MLVVYWILHLPLFPKLHPLREKKREPCDRLSDVSRQLSSYPVPPVLQLGAVDGGAVVITAGGSGSFSNVVFSNNNAGVRLCFSFLIFLA
jgi:hypothetical protein